MGNEAEDLITEDVENDELEEVIEEVEEDEGNAPQEKQLTQDQVNAIVQRRVAKLQKVNQQLEDDNGKTVEQLKQLEEEKKILEMALQQKQESEPTPDDFDGGEYDPAYLKARSEFDRNKLEKTIDQRVEEQVQLATKKLNEEQQLKQSQSALRERQTAHYRKAAELDLDDYESAEDKVIETLGTDKVNEIINNFDESPLLFYKLGKEPELAAKLNNMLEKEPIKGVAEIGRLIAEVKGGPKLSEAPDPDTPEEGNRKGYLKRGPKGATYE